MKKIIAITLLCLFAFAAIAQAPSSQTAFFHVQNEDGEDIIGAVVSIVGTNIGNNRLRRKDIALNPSVLFSIQGIGNRIRDYNKGNY